jgi:3-keto-disaccharide hydrolase
MYTFKILILKHLFFQAKYKMKNRIISFDVRFKITAIIIIGFFSLAAKSPSKAHYATTNNLNDTTYLWNGKDFSNLKFVLRDNNVLSKSDYSIKDGVLSFNTKKVGYFRTKKKYSNFKIHAEWRWPEKTEKGNSGILVFIQTPDSVWPKCIQVNFKKDNAGDLIAMNGTMFNEAAGKPKDTALKLHESNEKSFGGWNTCDAICQGDSILVYVNGKMQNRATHINVKNGTVGLQLEGKPIEFMNIYIVK